MNISIIIPCHNAEDYLAQALGSALDQSRPPDEIIVVDDGSTDGSLAIARHFEVICAGRVRVHSEHSGNAARTRNIGAALAKGDALMFLDADDILAPDTLAQLALALHTEPSGISACPWRRLKLINGQWLSQPASCAPRHLGQDALSAWLTGWYYPPCSVLWSREAYLQTGGWDETSTLNDDGDIMMRALASNLPLVESVQGVAYYRILANGQTSLSGKRFTYSGLRGRLEIISKIARILEDQNRIESYRAPVSRAFALIAADAAGRFGALGYQAHRLKRHYAPTVAFRLQSRFRRRPAGTRPDPVPPFNQEEVIRFGLDSAESILAAKVSATACAKRSSGSVPEHVPAVTVIIPVFNRASVLPRTLKSVLCQSFPDFEVLIVDDGSSDDPAAVVAAMQDSRLRYIRQPHNQGVAAARNRGLREARAPLVAFLDDDYEWFPEKLALQVALFEQAEACVGLIYTGVETVSDNGGSTLQIPSARGDLYDELLVKNILHGCPSSGMMRRNVIAAVGFFDETLPAIEDYDYWLRVCRYFQVDCISQALVRYNDFRDSQAAQSAEDRRSLNLSANLEARAQLFRKHGDQMQKAGVAHLFLLDSASRDRAGNGRISASALRQVLSAMMLAPMSWGVRNEFKQMLKLAWRSRSIRGNHRPVRNLSGAGDKR